MRDLGKAIVSLYPNSNWSLNGETYEGLEWFDGNDKPKPTKEELEAEAERLHQIWLDNEYQRLRAAEYPPFADQFDLLYHGGMTAWKAEIDKVKNKYPKPEDK